MGRGARVSDDVVKAMRRMRDDNVSWTKIGKYFGHSPAWGMNLLNHRHLHGNIAKKRGPPRKTSEHLDDTIRHLSQNRHARDRSAGRILKLALDCNEAVTGKRTKISERIVQLRLKSWNVRKVTPVENPLTYHHRTMRVIWALDMLDKLKKDKNYLNYVFFSDEASAKFDCGRHTIRIFPGEGRHNADFQRKLPPGRFSVMCHETITRDGPLSFFIVDGSINQFSYSVMLAKKVIPKIRERRKDKNRVIWMHDNAPSHKAKLVQAYLKKCRLTVLPWPPLSPDMNPIENVWNIMWDYVGKRCPNTKKNLERLLYEAWDQLYGMFPLLQCNSKCTN
ncbi:hypothetical protein RvY_16930 [Ramazzottius varieornatus]|uniref:Tc1-like transposase DDE domain-containing protein n=1 Tax=Ramazzottius varieornatus TaxID=947166 RepID=A0A1D1W098_RAMVA|nr:hypothetical protein RvY_16930 [Ramazzottius varieornatus]